MRIQAKFNLHKYMCEIETIVERKGFKLSVETDFNLYRKIRRNQDGRSDLAPLFDAKMSFIPPNTGFWLKLVDEEGEILHTQAVRMHHLNEESLFDHVAHSKLMYVPPEIHDVDDYDIRISESFKEISNTISYHGDAWIHKSLRTSRLNLLLGRYGLAAAKLFWNVDCYFAFMSNDNVTSGLDKRAGFFNSRPATWAQDDHVLCRYWLVWLEKQDIDELIEIPPAELLVRRKRTSKSDTEESAKADSDPSWPSYIENKKC